MVLAFLDRPDQLAREIGERYIKWKSARDTWEAEKREIRQYVFATDTTKTTNSSLPWKNKTTLPKLCQIRDNLHANYMAALFPNDKWFKWEGASKDDSTKNKVRAIEAYMRNKTRVAQFRNEVSRLVYDYIDYGNAFADVEYVNETFVDEDGLPVDGYIGPRVVRISPMDIVFNVAAHTFEGSPKIVRSMSSLGDLRKQMATHPEADYLDGVFTNMRNVRAAFGGLGSDRGSFSVEEQTKIDAFQVDGFGSAQEYFESGMVEILEFEGDIYDPETDTLLENHVVTIVDRMFILRKEPINNWLGRSTKKHVGWRLRPDNLMAMGPLDNLVGMQYRIDHLENLKADVFDQIAFPALKIRGEVDDFEWEPGVRIYMDNDGDVSFLAPDTTALNADFQIQRLMDQMEEMAGAPKQAMGFRTPGEKTAFEVQQLQNAASRIFQNKISFFEEQFIEPLLNAMLETARRNLDGQDIIDSIDDDLGVREFMSVTQQDIKASGKLRPIGARHFAEKAQVVQNLNNFANSALGQDPEVKVHISGKKTAKMMEEALGLEDFSLFGDNIRISEQAETARLSQAAQDQVAQDSITDTDDPTITDEDLFGDE